MNLDSTTKEVIKMIEEEQKDERLPDPKVIACLIPQNPRDEGISTLEVMETTLENKVETMSSKVVHTEYKDPENIEEPSMELS